MMPKTTRGGGQCVRAVCRVRGSSHSSSPYQCCTSSPQAPNLSPFLSPLSGLLRLPFPVVPSTLCLASTSPPPITLSSFSFRCPPSRTHLVFTWSFVLSRTHPMNSFLLFAFLHHSLPPLSFSLTLSLFYTLSLSRSLPPSVSLWSA